MKFIALLIKDESAKTPAALRYARALIRSGQPPASVFFYGRGVQQAIEAVHEDWRQLKQLCDTKLVLCSASAEKYGIASDDDFDIGGLGDLIESGLNNSRVISFG